MKNATFKEPIDLLIVEDAPNACPFDGVRTVELETRDDYVVEQCPCCGRIYNFWYE